MLPLKFLKKKTTTTNKNNLSYNFYFAFHVPAMTIKKKKFCMQQMNMILLKINDLLRHHLTLCLHEILYNTVKKKEKKIQTA